MAPPSAPAPSTSSSSLSSDIEEIHRTACQHKETFYIDPVNGLYVFTAYHLAKRPCCGCGCRHCPYRRSSSSQHINKSMASNFNVTIHGDLDELSDDPIDILFWSGGKDSYMALQRLDKKRVVLMTTYEGSNGRVGHQGVQIKTDIIPQTKTLGIPFCAVPLGGSDDDDDDVKGSSGNEDYVKSISRAIEKLKSQGLEIRRLVFGDLHLWSVRSWRDNHLTGLGIELHYPLWNVPYEQLLNELERANAQFTISAVDENTLQNTNVRIGDIYNKSFVKNLPQGIDQFGENGEFHTLARIM